MTAPSCLVVVPAYNDPEKSVGRVLHAFTARLSFARRPLAFRSGQMEPLAVKP